MSNLNNFFDSLKRKYNLGKISFFCSLTPIAIFVIIFLVARIFPTIYMKIVTSSGSFILILIRMLIFISAIAPIISVTSGVIGMSQKEYTKKLPIAGIVISLLEWPITALYFYTWFFRFKW